MVSKTILIADDEFGFRYPLSIYLKSKGFNVVEAKNREEVFEKISDVDILIMDVIFPEERQGIDIVKEIRRNLNKRINSIPVIFYSILNERTNADELKGVDKRSYRWMQKPFELSDLLKVISELK